MAVSGLVAWVFCDRWWLGDLGGLAIGVGGLAIWVGGLAIGFGGFGWWLDLAMVAGDRGWWLLAIWRWMARRSGLIRWWLIRWYRFLFLPICLLFSSGVVVVVNGVR
uniref:Uncharacterized protein n=1 Tax=Fagus sylvatica TaxID=28930 RepID=A0A2N9GR84_FAGSY